MTGAAGNPSAAKTSFDPSSVAAGDAASPDGVFTRTFSVTFFNPGAIAVFPCGRYQETLTVRPWFCERGRAGSIATGEGSLAVLLSGEASSTTGRREETAQMKSVGFTGPCPALNMFIDIAPMLCAGERGTLATLPGVGAYGNRGWGWITLAPGVGGNMFGTTPPRPLPRPGVSSARLRDSPGFAFPIAPARSWSSHSPAGFSSCCSCCRYLCSLALLDRPSSVGHWQGKSASTQLGHGSGGSAPHFDFRLRHCCQWSQTRNTLVSTQCVTARTSAASLAASETSPSPSIAPRPSATTRRADSSTRESSLPGNSRSVGCRGVGLWSGSVLWSFG